MENLNAEQVKDRIELCFEKKTRCEDCTIPPCLEKQLKNALALITSQEQRIKELEAETKRLESLCVSKDIIIGDLSKENERLRVDVLVEPLKMVTKITSYLKSLLTKGYPIVTYEFIDRLEEKMLGGHKDPAGDKGIRIDQIAKEMLEGE